MHTALSPGDHVQVRGRSWLLSSVTAHADCSELNLEPAADGHPSSPGRRTVLLAPFDRPVKRTRQDTVRVVSRRAWMEALRLAVLAQREAGGLAAPVQAAIDLLPHQLEPAIAVVREGARRLLLADAVGLGKTIEAGIVLAELRARSALDRVLVLAPPGLCVQWTAELADRFGLDCGVTDAVWLRSQRAILPSSINPWSVPGLYVASLDFAKRPEVRRTLEQVLWDALVVDEAHLAAGDSERRSAAHAMASRSRLVLLLTATPHSGDPRTFQALCGIGALAADDPIVMFRRGRAEAGLACARRVHLHRVRDTPAEQDVRRQLDAYVRRVWARRTGSSGLNARLAMIVLLKRSLSGMAPLRQSLVTRLTRLGGPASPPAATQLELAWDEEPDPADEAPSAVLGAAGLDDEREERSMLGALAALAHAAEACDSKRRTLSRLLRRLREPAIVFTEYRDTLAALQGVLDEEPAVLHGAMDRAERSEVVRRFNDGGARVLLATDAAAEGLNLQHRCRLVVNLELPWNPMRLEQRIGRVDRIGQHRSVHAINLVAAGSAESGLLARLARRLDRAKTALGPLQDVLGVDDEAVMARHLGLSHVPTDIPPRPPRAAATSAAAHVRRPVLIDEARDLVECLQQRRRLLRASERARNTRTDARAVRLRTGVQATAVRLLRLPDALRRPGILAVFRVESDISRGLTSSHELVPLFLPCPCPRPRRARDVRELARAVMEWVVPRVKASVQSRVVLPSGDAATFDRDARLVARAPKRRLVQRGLFDRRDEREADAADGGLTTDIEAPGRSATGGAGSEPARRRCQLVLLLFVTR